MPKPEIRLAQKDLAEALGLTDRRVRQLEADFILPAPRDGLYDVAVCRERYRLYRSGKDADWDEFYVGTADAARRATELVRALDTPTATLADVRAASVAVQEAAGMARFITACRSDGDAERRFVMPYWERQESDGLLIVFSRALEILAAQEGVTPEVLRRRLIAERTEPLPA